MDAGILRFDPASEFEIIEPIDFEEEVQRPEELRFFTLDEQLNDYFDKVLPKKKNITKFEYKKIAQEVERLRELYEDTITFADTDYTVDLSRKNINVSWVNPIYHDFELSKYSYAESWAPLYERGRRSMPNYYPQMLGSLPKPYKTTSTAGRLLDEDAMLVNEDGLKPINALATYQRTKGVIHEDGSFSVVKVPVLNTGDDIRIKGFYIGKRGLDIPNPLADHPFLGSVEPNKLITSETLNEVFPTIEAIMTHGVPRTEDPYREGLKYMKLYDVKLSGVPWNVWKDKFPTVNPVVKTPEILSITFPIHDVDKPSKNLQDTYIIPWSPAIEPRFWLMMQEDAGTMVVKMLMSKASEAGLLPPDTPGDKPEAQFPTSSPEECLIVDDFESFLNSGIYRSASWDAINKASKEGKPLPQGKCIPTTYIAQERNKLLTQGRISWKESTEFDILREQQTLLKLFQSYPLTERKIIYEKYASQPESELRKEIRGVLRDTERTDSDKADAIEKIIRETSIKDKIHFDKTNSFVVCDHTLAVLKGELADDRLKFYADWTAIDGGFRSCKFCGEQVNADVFVSQDDFDEDGNVLISYDTLHTNTFHGESHVAAFTNSLNQMKPLFLLENPGEAILYLLLSLLQVLPTETQLLPVIQFIRKLTAVLRTNKKIEKNAKERIEGILGIVGMVVLLQTHNPFLIPRRSFGSKVLKLTGFPRDSEDPTDSPVLDIVISVLKTTFESSPNTFKGPITTLLRTVIRSSKDVRKESVIFLKQALVEFKANFISAKERYTEPVESQVVSQISLPILPVQKSLYSPDETLTKEEMPSNCNVNAPKTFLAGKLPPNITQEPVKLVKTTVSKLATYIGYEMIIPTSIKFSEADIRKRVTRGFPKGMKLDKIDDFLRSDTDGIAFLSLLNRILDILALAKFDLKKLSEYRRVSSHIETKIEKSLLRDAARGIVYELFHDISSSTGFNQIISKAVQRDLVLNMILTTKDIATRQDSELRAKERNVFKARMRQMNDTEREITKMLLDIGIAPYVITNEDREIFAKEYHYSEPEKEYAEILREVDENMPEEGYNAERDVEDDMQPMVDGRELQTDYGDYTDRREERYDREYENFGNFDFEESYGV